MAHVLVVGGTGILEKVSLFLASHDNVVSVLAKSPDDFKKLKDEAKGLKGTINPISINYDEVDGLAKHVTDSIEKYGPVTLAVNWVQEHVLKAVEVIANILNATSPICRYFQVLPMTEHSPVKERSNFEKFFLNLERVLYRIIVLGFKKEAGEERLLSHEEISDGIIKALRDDSKKVVIGADPWDERPLLS